MKEMRLKWISNPPDRAGWWWTRVPLRSKKMPYMVSIVCIAKYYGRLVIETRDHEASQYYYRHHWDLERFSRRPGREWAGPIEEPEEVECDMGKS